MANTFSEDDREDLLERGFNDEQLEYLESLEMDAEQLYFDICHIMDDFDDTPEQIIKSYKDANEEHETNEENENEDEDAQEGGRRRNKRKSRKTRKNKRNKSKRNKSKRNKSRRSRR